MKIWEKRAQELLEKSLSPIPAELNELDWKSALSDKSERLAKHLSAFAHLPNGGFMVFGLNNDGMPHSLTTAQIDEILKKLGNIARNNLGQPVALDHAVIRYREAGLLIVYIAESPFKPVHIRGETFFESYKDLQGKQ